MPCSGPGHESSYCTGDLLYVGAHFVNRYIYCDILGFLGNMTYTPVAFP